MKHVKEWQIGRTLEFFPKAFHFVF